jgi:hypothetical protein
VIPVAVPSLDEILKAPERAQGLPLEVRQALLLQCATRITECSAVLAALAAAPASAAMEAPAGDRKLVVEEVAGKLHVSKDWVRENTTVLGGAKIAGQWRFSEAKVEAYFERQRRKAQDQ